MNNVEEKIIKHSALLPALFLLVLWLIAITEHTLDLSFHRLGVYPRSLIGLPGIIMSPFVHGDFKHLFANSVPLFVMGAGIIYFYRSLSYRVFLIIWIASGICLWIGGRPSYHIGASGLVYGMAAFLFFSGAIRRDPRLAAISLIIVFLYGGMVWGIFPIWPTISWEGHLFGGISGLACAIAYRHHGPQRKIYSWEIEEEEPDMDDEFNPENQPKLSQTDNTSITQTDSDIRYTSNS